LKASTELMSGFGVPSLTTTPTPTRPRFTRLPAANLPLPARSLTAPGVSTATSKTSPPSIRLVSAPTVSFWTVTLWPLCFSNSGTSASTTCLNAPAVKTLSSAAAALPDAPAAIATAARPNKLILIASSILVAPVIADSSNAIIAFGCDANSRLKPTGPGFLGRAGARIFC
jgi:hypothetical protein